MTTITLGRTEQSCRGTIGHRHDTELVDYSRGTHWQSSSAHIDARRCTILRRMVAIVSGDGRDWQWIRVAGG